MDEKATEKKEQKKVKDTKKKSSVNRATTIIGVSGVIIGLIVGLLIPVVSSGVSITGAAISQGEIEDRISTIFEGVTVMNVEDLGSGYAVDVTSPQGMGTLFITKDGKYLSPGEVIDLDELAIQMDAAKDGVQDPAQQEPVDAGLVKSEKPVVELFVMSYCPFGLQMEKAFLPVSELLGDEADFSIKFVHYIMHGEMEAVENARDYCVQKDFPEQFNDYMTCFIKSGKNGVDNSAVAQACLALSDVDPVAIDSCVAKARTEFGIDEDLASEEQYPRFGIDAVASNGYGVQGSPTLVINGAQVSVGRTPEAVKAAVCDAFLVAPETCDSELSSNSFEPGFGMTASEATSAATCG